MAKYTVRMSCGHEQEVELFGKYSERRKKIDFFENSGLCKECYKEMLRKKQESETLSFHVSVSTDIDEEDGSINAVVEGKDRTKVHKQNEYITNPTLLDWQVVIDRNKGKKDIRTAKLNMSVNAEIKNIEKKATELDIEEDTSQEELDKLYNQISDTLKSLNSTQKAKAQQAIKSANLLLKYREYTDKATLLKYLDIIKG